MLLVIVLMNISALSHFYDFPPILKTVIQVSIIGLWFVWEDDVGAAFGLIGVADCPVFFLVPGLTTGAAVARLGFVGLEVDESCSQISQSCLSAHWAEGVFETGWVWDPD